MANDARPGRDCAVGGGCGGRRYCVYDDRGDRLDMELMMSKHEKACWLRVPPECPVRVPVMVSVALPDGVVETGVGEFQGGEGCARVCVGDLEFRSEAMTIEAGATDVLEQLARRVRSDLAVGRIVRELVGRKPLLAKMVEAVAAVLVADEVGEEVLKRLTSLQQPGVKEVS